MGINELVNNDDQNPAFVAIDAAYTTANAIAAYTQAYLAARVLTTRKETYNTTGLIAKDEVIGYNPHQTIERGYVNNKELAVTFGGQALFLSTMQW